LLNVLVSFKHHLVVEDLSEQLQLGQQKMPLEQNDQLVTALRDWVGIQLVTKNFVEIHLEQLV
jgi:hypothetical protein